MQAHFLAEKVKSKPSNPIIAFNLFKVTAFAEFKATTFNRVASNNVHQATYENIF